MDRNSIIGILVICAIMFAWMYYNAPSAEEQAQQKKTRDSLELVAIQKAKDTVGTKQLVAGRDTASVVKLQTPNAVSDSAKTAALNSKYDVFSSAASDSNAFYTLENEKIKATVSKKGGRICSVFLKEYRRHDSTSLELFDDSSSSFGLLFDTERNRTINTGDLYFQSHYPTPPSPTKIGEKGVSKLSMRLFANADGSGKSNSYIEYEYSLAEGAYMLVCNINVVGMGDVIASNLGEFTLNWKMRSPSQEKNLKNQRDNSTVYFKYMEEEPDYLSEMSDETKTLDAKTKWVAFKQQFFTSVLIADDFFDKSGADITSNNETSSLSYVKSFSTNLSVPYSHKENESFGMNFYFGPNHFQTLKSYDLHLEKQIPLGWGIFGWVNKFLVIPVFNFLDSFNLNYAIIILCLTLIFKTLLFPIAYKTYTSSAKMRVLKPEIDELNKKFEKEDPMKKQQATMALYRKAGVNPLAGCIPALLQMPILIALFRFFPASIELRQQGFWWATDLSTYDSILDFGPVPEFVMTIYGDHISLWALLCTITTLIYTHMNSQMMSNPGAQQMPAMKYMIYLMPVMFLPFLNQFSAGLSYYYTLANVISFLQMFVIRRFVDEKKLHAKIAEHMKKPQKPASSFQQKLQKRMEDMKKQRNGSQKRVK